MTIDEHWRAIRRTFDRMGHPTRATMAAMETALAAHPRSARLWDRRGDLIQLLDTRSPDLRRYTLAEALRSYEQAVEVDPTYAPAYESLGYYHDVTERDPAAAETAFRQAVALGGGVRSWAGLARAMADQGRIGEALTVLEASPNPTHPSLAEVRAEIARRPT